MGQLRESYTAVLLRADRIEDGSTTEPYEAGWASEATLFVKFAENPVDCEFAVQISPDGQCWKDEGTVLKLLGQDQLNFCKITHFGNWLRIVTRVPAEGPSSSRVTVTLHLKA